MIKKNKQKKNSSINTNTKSELKELFLKRNIKRRKRKKIFKIMN